MNKRAHDISQRALEEAAPYTVPLAELLKGTVILHKLGVILVDPKACVDGIYTETVEQRYKSGVQGHWTPMDGTNYTALLEEGVLTTKMVRRTMALCLLALQQPPREAQLECYYCGEWTLSLGYHLKSGCQEFQLVKMMVYVEFLRGLPSELAGTVRELRSVSRGGRTIKCGPDVVYYGGREGEGKTLVTLSGVTMQAGIRSQPELDMKGLIMAVVRAAARDNLPLGEVVQAFKELQSRYKFEAECFHHQNITYMQGREDLKLSVSLVTLMVTTGLHR